MAPLAAFMAWPTSPSDPATTLVPPWRFPTAIDACTAFAGAVSVAGFCTVVNHIVAPWGVRPRDRRIAFTDEHRVEPASGGVCHRWGGVDGNAGVHRPSRHARARREVERV